MMYVPSPESLAEVMIVIVGIIVLIALRRRRRRTSSELGGEDTFQDMSIFDNEVAATAYEMDPLAEAEVYLAYGNRQQALVLLREAAVVSPQRADIRDKLLELESKRGAIS